MTLYRAQAVLHHVSGLPRDEASNTFWFDTVGATPDVAEAEAIAEMVRDFYVEVHAPNTLALADYLHRCITTNGHRVKVVPIDATTGLDERGLGFPPLWTENFDMLGRSVDTQPNPNEVALCLSFKSNESGAVPPARRRGRIYFGPLGGGATANLGDITVPIADLMSHLLEAGSWLKTEAATVTGREWDIYSRPYAGRGVVPRPGNPRGDLPALPARIGALYAVDELWVDNAFDTIRKRGERPTARITA